MVLTRSAAARLAAAVGDQPVTEELLNAEQQTASTGLAKGRRSKRAGTAAKLQGNAACMSNLQDGSEQADPLEEEMPRFEAELEALSFSGDGGEEGESRGMSESAAHCAKESSIAMAGVEGVQDHGADKRLKQSAGVSGNTSGLVGKAETGPTPKERVSRVRDNAGAMLSAGPELYSTQKKGSVEEDLGHGPEGTVPKEEGEKAGNADSKPAEVSIVPSTRLVLSRKERAARARVLKEALVNVDEKQRKWQEFAAEKQPRKGGQDETAAEASSEQSSGESSSSGGGWVFGKKVAFSFKPKSSSPAKKGSRTLVKSPTEQTNSTPPLDAAPAPVTATSDQEGSGETPSQAVEQTPLRAPRPALALTTPAVEAQARSGNPVLDLRFLFPKATPPEPSTPQSSGDSATNPIDISPGERSSSDSGEAFSISAPGEGEGSEFGGAATSSEDAFTTEVRATPAPASGGFASPFSVESASPALKEILRAAHSFASERGATSPLNPNPTLNPNLNLGAGRQRGRRESYSDVFASPTLVDIFKGARQTVVQKAGPERAHTELEKLTQAAKEYAASRAQLAVEKSPLGVLCQKESELALSFAEKLQLADPTVEPASWGGYWQGENRVYREQLAGNTQTDDSHGSGNQDMRYFDGRTVQVYSPFLTANQAATPVGQVVEPSVQNETRDDLHENGTTAVRSFDGRRVEVHSGSGSANHAPPPIGQVADGPKERAGTLYVVVDTNCYLSASDMPAVRRIYEAAQSVAEGAQCYEWQGAERVVIVVPNAGEKRATSCIVVKVRRYVR